MADEGGKAYVDFNSNQAQTQRRKKIGWGVGVSLVIIIALVIGLSVGLTRDNDDDKDPTIPGSCKQHSDCSEFEGGQCLDGKCDYDNYCRFHIDCKKGPGYCDEVTKTCVYPEPNLTCLTVKDCPNGGPLPTKCENQECVYYNGESCLSNINCRQHPRGQCLEGSCWYPQS